MVQRRVGRWTLSEHSPYASVTQMLRSLGWRSLGQRRSDSRLCLFYKITYGLVAIDMPSYVVLPLRTLRNSHILGFRQIQTTVDYYKYSFYPLSIVQWNRLPAHISRLPLRGQCAQSVTQCHKCQCIVFITVSLFLTFKILTLSSFIPLQLTILMGTFYF